VAQLIVDAGFSVVRRSKPDQTAISSNFPAVILGDTIGELRKFYAMGDVVFVGRSLVDLGHRQHGSDMIEPAALAKPTVVGPFTANFAEAMNAFVKADAMVVVENAAELAQAVEGLLTDAARGKAMGIRARDAVKAEQGATQRHADLILDTLDSVLTMGKR
jgi:3-deoxy-D-manno-octulosonic-acid transferase